MAQASGAPKLALLRVLRSIGGEKALASMRSGLDLSPQLSAKEKALKGVLNQAMKMIGRG